MIPGGQNTERDRPASGLVRLDQLAEFKGLALPDLGRADRFEPRSAARDQLRRVHRGAYRADLDYARSGEPSAQRDTFRCPGIGRQMVAQAIPL